MSKLKRLGILFAVLLFAVGLVSSCTPGSAAPQVSPLTESEVRAFADPIAENFLYAISTGSYIDYTRDFTPTLKSNHSEDYFKDINPRRLEAVGAYVSKEFWMMSYKNERINVAYRAKFVKEPADVIVSVYFKNISGKWYVDGIQYDSPLMRQYDC